MERTSKTGNGTPSLSHHPLPLSPLHVSVIGLVYSSVRPSICPSICPSVRPSVHLSLYASPHLSHHLPLSPLHVSVIEIVHPSVCLFVCPSVRTSLSPSLFQNPLPLGPTHVYAPLGSYLFVSVSLFVCLSVCPKMVSHFCSLVRPSVRLCPFLRPPVRLFERNDCSNDGTKAFQNGKSNSLPPFFFPSFIFSLPPIKIDDSWSYIWPSSPSSSSSSTSSSSSSSSS